MRNLVRFLVLFCFLFFSQYTFAKNWYLNDASTSGDVYCTAIGASGNTGLSPSSPKLFNTANASVLATIVAAATAGDVIFIDAMDVSMTTAASNIPLNKAISIVGAGPTKTILRGPGGTSTAKFAIITSSNVVFRNFYCTQWQSTGSGNASCLEVTAGASNLTGIVFDAYWMDQNVGSGGDGSCRISSTGVGTVTATIKNMLTTCNYTGSYAGGFWIEGDGHNITFTDCFFGNNERETSGGAINIIGISSSDPTTTKVFVDRCTFKGNKSNNGYGGAIAVAGAKLVVTNSCFSNNSISNTSNYGSAIAGLESSRIHITNSTFNSNSGGKGGHVSVKYISSSYVAGTNIGPYELIINKCSFDNTTSSTKCVYFGESGTFSIDNSTFTTAGTSQINASSTSWTLTNSARSAGTNPTFNAVPTTINTLVASAIPSPTCNGAVSGSCPTVSLSCTSDNLPPVIKAHDSTYVTNSSCLFTVPTYTAIDFCDAAPSVTSVPPAGTVLDAGTTTPVIITATDVSGNSTSITVYLTTPACTPTCGSTLTSASGTNSQSLCIGSSIANITYSTVVAIGISNNGVSGANGLPNGVSASWAANVITISGTPTASGTFSYSITLTGGTCAGEVVTGTITVNENPTATAGAALSAICQGATSAVMGGSVGGSATGGTWS
nr:hypothetical protein [Crocinitomicaceae bacterium]